MSRWRDGWGERGGWVPLARFMSVNRKCKRAASIAEIVLESLPPASRKAMTRYAGMTDAEFDSALASIRASVCVSGESAPLSNSALSGHAERTA